MKRMRLFGQSMLVVSFAAVGTLFAAQTSDALKIHGDFKHWYLVHSTLITKDENKFGLFPGVHLIYVNATGFDRLKRGGSTPYPDGTMFTDDVREFSATDDGSYLEGAARKAITLMVKDSKKYASTGGWGCRASRTSTDSTLGLGRNTVGGTRPTTAAEAQYATFTDTAP